jgi:hypothetical protein
MNQRRHNPADFGTLGVSGMHISSLTGRLRSLFKEERALPSVLFRESGLHFT